MIYLVSYLHLYLCTCNCFFHRLYFTCVRLRGVLADLTGRALRWCALVGADGAKVGVDVLIDLVSFLVVDSYMLEGHIKGMIQN